MGTSIAILGPGAIGGCVAAWLARNAELEITLCARTPFEVLRVQTPEGVIESRPRVLVDPAQAVVVDWVLIAVKTYDVQSVAPWLEALLGPKTRVLVLQNGVEHVERWSPFVDAARIVPAVVNLPAERDGPGRIRQRRFGSLVVPEGKDGAKACALFAHTKIAVSTTPEFKTDAWKKLALNCAGAVSALTLQPSGVVERPAIADVMRDLVRECVSVGRAEGAALNDDLPEEVIASCRAAPPDSINSLLADRLAGRPMEIDARHGVIVRSGARHHIPTPANAMVLALLEAAGDSAQEIRCASS